MASDSFTFPDQIEYCDCYIAFIDILGFSELVKHSIENEQLLSAMIKALNIMASLPSGQKSSRTYDDKGNVQERHWQIQTRAFSDCIVIFMPLETQAISHILFMVRYIHDRMIELGMCLRGAVTIGKMYWNQIWSNPNFSVEGSGDVLYDRKSAYFPITLGPGLIEAYKLESECAIYPRILISRELFTHVKDRNLPSFPLIVNGTSNCQLHQLIRQDADGVYFLDVLCPAINRNDTEKIVRENNGSRFTIQWIRNTNSHETVLSKINCLVMKECQSSNPKIRAKYEWLRTYSQQSSMSTR